MCTDARAVFVIGKDYLMNHNDPGKDLNRSLKFIEKEGAFFQAGSYIASPT